MLALQAKAPLFSAESTQGPIDLSAYIGQKYIILIFYPRDHTPICTKQLCAAEAASESFAEVDAVVFGVNPASTETHRGFSQRYGYSFPLIADEGEKIRTQYDVGKIMGLFGQQRIVYIIDKNGRICYARKGNPPTDELLQAIRQHAEQNA